MEGVQTTVVSEVVLWIVVSSEKIKMQLLCPLMMMWVAGVCTYIWKVIAYYIAFAESLKLF